MEHGAEIVIVTVLGLSLIILFIFGIVSFCQPKKKGSEMESTREYEKLTARTVNQRKKRKL
jgi:hypothetical protein